MPKPLKGNKGEWSEIYVLFRLLGEGKIYAADENLERMENTYLPIIKIIREETAGERCEYICGRQVKVCINGKKQLSVPAAAFTRNADFLFSQLQDKEISGSHGSFSLEQTELFMNKILVHKIKAPAAAINQQFGGKADITMEVQDKNSGIQMETAFSIKSEFASPATLSNASQATNFIYQVHGITDEQMEAFNAINTKHKVLDRIQYLKNCGASISFVKPFRQKCLENLELVSSDMPKIIGLSLYYYYWEGVGTFRGMVERLAKDNPLHCSHPKVLYEKRLKDFLYDCFSGLNLGKDWNGSRDVSGGYIVVKDDGEVLAYHTYIQDAFRQFLLDHCCFDKGSTTRHNYGSIYKENGDYFLRLNLQIRFQ